jgi:hypothetical protein
MRSLRHILPVGLQDILHCRQYSLRKTKIRQEEGFWGTRVLVVKILELLFSSLEPPALRRGAAPRTQAAQAT